ncbi:GNAT family N-acetyltransferase [Hymenobacter psoromatis]|uniref:GNAT family N-acetyltransferase n=1 Tax=Hymenobacter psoromatis TaxID=1484116 RepID=UPI001CBAC476|nr:GNAT family N-acetyltransferase [Hymenobacter psoromatis]
MPPTPFPSLEAPRLRLRAFAPTDVSTIVTLANDYEVAKNTLNIPHPYHEEDARQWVQHTRESFQQQAAYTFALELRATGEFIGGIGLNLEPRFDRAEAGYWLGRPYWGRGLATEALGALLRFGFAELGLNKIYATHFAENLASGRVMLKNGMVKEGELAQHTKRDGRYHDLWQYRLLRAEYVGRASAR